MRKYKMLFSLLFLAAILAAVIAPNLKVYMGTPYELSVPLIALCTIVAFLLPRSAYMKGMTTAGINMEVWEKMIEGNLFKDDSFIASGTDDSQYVDALTVHIPNSGSVPTIVKNLALGGARQNTSQRTDTTVDYNIDTYFALPWLLSKAEQVQLSYSKRESLLSEMQSALNNKVADDIIYRWGASGTAGTSNILRTSGVMNNDPTQIGNTAYDSTNAAAGNRLLFGLYDLRQAKKFLDKQNCPAEDRHILLPTEMLDQLVSDMVSTKYRGVIGDVFDLSTGDIKKVMGFTIHYRSSTLIYDNSATPVKKAITAAGANTDNLAALFWQKGGVSFAKGGVTVRYNADQADAFGDVMSAEVRFGGTIRRATESKVGAIVQAVAN